MAILGSVPVGFTVHHLPLPFPLLPLILLPALLFGLGLIEAQEQKCQAGKITLLHASPVTTTTDVFGVNAKVSFYFCALATDEGSCTNDERGYVEVTTETECVESFTEMVQPLTANGPRNTYLVVASKVTGSTFRLNMQCNSDGLPSEVSYGGEIRTDGPESLDDSHQKHSFEADFSSVEGCEVNNFFCEDADDCVGTSCINGICIDTTCPLLTTVSQVATVPSNYLSMVRVTDCYGFPVQGLGASNISVDINGLSIDDPPLSFDVESVRREAPHGGIVQITTLMIQQTQYVTLHYEEGLKQALTALLSGLAEGNATNHYIALVVFDGASKPVTLQSHTTNFALLTNAVNRLPVTLSDPLSTNLYGAVVFGLEASYRMGSVFEGDTYTTLIVFADGYDTAARIPETEAVQKAQYFATANVTTMALAISNRSDTTFLRKISKSGYFATSSSESIVPAFEQMAQRILSLHRNVYYVLMCIPNRKGNVTVTVSVGPPEVYQNTKPLEYLVNTDGFGGGCSRSVLEASITESGDDSSSFVHSSTLLPIGGSINSTVNAYGTFFFHTQCVEDDELNSAEEEKDVGCIVDASADIGVTGDPLTVLVLFEPRCILSPFCFDDSFNKSYTLKADKSKNYQFMLLSGLGEQAVFTISSRIPSKRRIPPSYLDSNQTGIRDVAGEADQAAIIIFATTTFGIALSICILFCCRQRGQNSYAAGAPYRGMARKGEHYTALLPYTSLDLSSLSHKEQQMKLVNTHRREYV